MLNPFVSAIDAITLPHCFPSPFQAEPHPLCVLAARELQDYLGQQGQWAEELQHGKMFGVLVVQDPSGRVGYLTAFSGNLAGMNQHDCFVPPVYDLLDPNGFFKIEEQSITDLNQLIAAIEQSEEYLMAKNDCEVCTEWVEQQLAESKANLKLRKQHRDAMRENNQDAGLADALVRESQHDKAEHKRLERQLHSILEEKQAALNSIENQLAELKAQRKSLSAGLQMKIFDRFRMLNANGEAEGLPAIFAPTAQGVPPAGAGECAGPKLLQYAFLHELRPICMAEFWWGSSPKTEVRHHGHFYPACKGKCEPILGHMLKGLAIDHHDPDHQRHIGKPLEVVFEDEWLLVVNKPEGMLSVPGRGDGDSVLSRLAALYPHATGPLLVHRLDMATSGLLLVAKTKAVHKALQSQFKNRTVKKRYIALLDGIVVGDGGMVDLPLCPDIMDRPRQMVDHRHGKPAITRWEVIARCAGQTRVAFYPFTGRTHQLRVHAAHAMGLHCAIVGDALYGTKADRLYLHAEKIGFVHPVTGEEISVAVEAPF
ncbi:MAG: pseudouridine synthase [Breznakibacter sp.]